jgi:hypothetical protein
MSDDINLEDTDTHEKNIAFLRGLLLSIERIGNQMGADSVKSLWEACHADIAGIISNPCPELGDGKDDKELLLAYREIAEELREHF